ncbi:hypothetical protein ACWEVD_17595 [Nocardia thailandica]
MVVRQQTVRSGIDEWLATTAAVLALLLAAGNLVGTVRVGWTAVKGPDELDNSLALFTALGGAVMTFALVYGAYHELRRDETGRHVLFLAAVVQLGLGALGVLAAVTSYDSGYGIRWFAEGSAPHAVLDALTGLPGAVTAIVHDNLAGALTALVLGGLLLIPLLRVAPGQE